jgi:tetratricopeptide (TPR) repeat protein
VIRYGGRIVQSLRARPFRALAALALLALALGAAGVNLWAWYQLREADRLAEGQRFSQAFAHYARCLRVWRWSASTHFQAARAARRARMYPEAEEHLAACEALQGGNAGALPVALERLLLRAQTGDIGPVEEPLWERVKSNGPDTPLILEGLARGYVRMLRVGTAQRCLRLLLERQPDNIEGLVMRGWIRQGNADPDEARNDYRRALELDPDRDDARLSLAQLLLRDGSREALTQFEYLITRLPDNLDVMVGLAEAYRVLGEPEKARGLLDAVLAKDPGNAKGLSELGALTFADGDVKKGEVLLRKAIEADPANLDAHYLLYLCLVQQPGREAEAAEQRERHKRVEADRNRLAQIVSKEMSSAPNDPNLHYEVGTIYLRYGKAETGLRWLYNALKLDPAHQPSHQALFEYYQRMGDAEMAELHRRQLRAGPVRPVEAGKAPR